MKRMVPVLALCCVAAQCGGPPQQGVSSDFRIDQAGERDSVDSHSTRMCVAPDGTTYVVWVDDRTGFPNVWMNRKLPVEGRDQGWLPAAIQVNQFGDSNVWNPDVACDSNGLVYIVWEDDRDGEVESHQIYFQVSSDQGTNWLPEDRLLENDTDGRSNSFNPRIVTSDPKVYVVWSDNLNGAFDILMAQSFNRGLEWAPPVRVDSDLPGSAWSAFPQIALNGPDQLFVVWEDFRGGAAGVAAGSDVWFSRSTDGGLSFPSDIRIDTTDAEGANNSFVPKIGADGGNIYIAWHDDRNGEANDVYMAYSGDAGVSFGPDQRADSTDSAGFNQSLYPDVCVSGNKGHVAWHDARPGGFYRIWYNNAVAGNWQQAEFQLDDHKQEGERASLDVRLSCAGDQVAAAWLDQVADEADLGFNDIYYDYSLSGGDQASWTSNDRLRVDSVGKGTAFKTDLNFEIRDGMIEAAWTDGRNGTTDVFFQQFEAGTEMNQLLVVPNP